MPRPKWKPAEELTPFARLVREGYMWRQMPPLSVSQLADLTGISKQAMWGWFQHGSVPRRDTVLQLARVTGLDVDMLLRAAGLPDTRMNDAEHRLRIRMCRLTIRRIVAELDVDTSLPDRDRQAFKTWLHSHALLIVKGLNVAEDDASALPDELLRLSGEEAY